MPSNGWTLRSSHRLLELSVGGRWYLGFTLAVGVVAIYSSNNVIYLLESLLLSSLLVSGVLSEIALTRIKVTREIDDIFAGQPGTDVFVVENTGNLPLYCIELGEYRGETRELSAFLLALPGRAKVRVRSRQVVADRGRHHWDGVVAATSFPFGFARKLRLLPDPGTRIVWPRPAELANRRSREYEAPKGEIEPVGDELTEVEQWGDASRVHWPVSVRAGRLMARPTRWSNPKEEIWLELRPPCPEMETEISRAAGSLAHGRPPNGVLVLVNKGERQRVLGRNRALDALALLPQQAKETESEFDDLEPYAPEEV